MRSARVNRAIKIAGSEDRIVLFAWSLDPEPRQHNLARVDRHGNVVWRAELPGRAINDCFNSLERSEEGYVARTFSDWTVWLTADGDTLRQERENVAA